MSGFHEIVDGVEQFKNPNKNRIHVMREWRRELEKAKAAGDPDVVTGLGEVERDHSGAPVKVGQYPLSIGGRLVKPVQIRAFQDWCTSPGDTLETIAQRHDISLMTLKSWKYQPWWREWAAIWFKHANVELQREVYGHDRALARAYGEILSGVRAKDHSVNAQAQIIKARMEMGVDPIVNKRPVHTTVNAIQNNNIVATPESVKELARKDPSKIRQWMATGMKPIELGSGGAPVEE